MKIIYSNFLPFNGFRAINILGVVFAGKKHNPLDEYTINHESIHTRQMLELFIVGFYLWYIFEWVLRLIIYKNRFKAYRNIGFEREAYCNDTNMNYLNNRRFYSFIKYLKG
ncbi:MAG: hypothetical protein PHO13_10520 [Fermentimonas sp.]|jgi:hypothetical protein|nr:hypothetical protein [Fermentimonas sp.]HBT86648.1 hypothetical protein [Porphyromonadaceae bacterium]MDD3189915.1 hypothetical protein [Fermentimonas sp.]MDD3511739.1 hypothetical protein [Fermentimonas sp.]MDD4285327.1 hypothetical protein [Fermentimonas sp.]